jgi:hypothetical protein
VSEKKHIWYFEARISATMTVEVVAETEQEAKERFFAGAWQKIYSRSCFDDARVESGPSSCHKGPGTNL